MPLTPFQEQLAKLLSVNRTPDAYLAGGAALQLQPNSTRYSNDLDYFHDSENRVQEAFTEDRSLLEKNQYSLHVERELPGFVQASVSKKESIAKVEWMHDTAWRFLPAIKDERVGYRLHPVDLAINKLLALVGRREARDFLDIVEAHSQILSLGALCWASCGKDPGFTPQSLLELLKRRSAYREDDFARLDLARPVSLPKLKQAWFAAVDEAEEFLSARPPEELGCLYYSSKDNTFITPTAADNDSFTVHFGRPGGVMPIVSET